MIVLEVVLVVALLAAGIVAFTAFLRWHAARVERRWRAAAHALQGELKVDKGWLGTTCSIATTLAGQRIAVTPGRTNAVFARASVQHAPGFELRVYPRPPSWLADGERAVLTGDPTFDSIFATESTDAELAKAWLDDATRDSISRAGAVWLHVRDAALIGNRAVFEFEEDAIERLARAVAAVAANAARREDPVQARALPSV